MRQFLRKRALIGVLSAVAFVGMVQPAAAGFYPNPTYRAQVTPNGVGDLLIFSYWTTDERDSLIAITNAFGGQAARYVHVRLREGVRSNEVINFTICLSPGDVWTAAITKIPNQPTDTSTLLVGNPGSCDDTVLAGQGLTAPPLPGQPVGLNAEFGYLTAYTMECSSLIQSGGILGGCPGPGIPTPGSPASPPFGNNDGGDDTIMGVATLVSATTGFSSSYNATSLIGFDALNETASVRNANNIGRAHSLFAEIFTFGPIVPLDGSLPFGQANNTSTGTARTDVANALASEGGVSKEMLLGRWTADPTFNSRTDVVLTFPTGDVPSPATPTDPVSIWVFNEEEDFNFSPREITLNWEVNICTFENSSDTPSRETELTCNGANTVLGGAGGSSILGPGGTFTGGWFRILNNNDRIPGGIGDGTGEEFDDINAIPDTTFPVIGLVFSFFEGVNGVFDQSYPIQWAAITGLGGIGSIPFCSPNNGPGFQNPAFPGCNAFNISTQFQPWTPPGGSGMANGVRNADGLPFPSTTTGFGRNRRSNSGSLDND